MYSFDSRIRYSEVSSQRELTLPALLDYFQDCSTFQSEDLNVGIDFLNERGVAWVLIAWQVEILRCPRYGELVTTGTWPYGLKGYYAYRNFVMRDSEGNDLARANSHWVLMDVKRGRPTRALQEIMDAYKLEEALPVKWAERKIPLPGDMERMQPFPVRKFHLDTNQHVNNGKYILMACDYLPKQFQVGRMRAEYKKSAVLGDMLYPSVAYREGKVLVTLADEEQNPYVIVELEEKND